MAARKKTATTKASEGDPAFWSIRLDDEHAPAVLEYFASCCDGTDRFAEADAARNLAGAARDHVKAEAEASEDSAAIADSEPDEEPSD